MSNETWRDRFESFYGSDTWNYGGDYDALEREKIRIGEFIQQEIDKAVKQGVLKGIEYRNLQLMEKVMKICTYQNATFDIVGGLYTDAKYRGPNCEPVDLINRWSVYKLITNNECSHGFVDGTGQDVAHEEIERILSTLTKKPNV